ncbi:MAG TPA: DEAD/DEAH box helicase [Gammaproteobacteria bacterium]|nr:DEAD/DEAH box helicase [Gammaproteobacteria bacterium]
MGFTKLGLSDAILEAVKKQGYDTPSPIQEKSIPLILEGKDVMAAAQTGTGKTAGFTLPILQLLSQGQPTTSNQVRTLILTPTRELAAQVQDSVATYGKHLPLKSAVVFGGVKINPQMKKLRGGVDILVATPGRLIDLYSQNAVKFDQLEIIVFDEADRMLDMGFLPDIKRILKILPAKRQTLMFSATFSDEIRKLAKSMVRNPVEISTTPRNTTVKSVKQWVHPVDKSKKQALLTKLIKDHGWYQVLVFSRTKHGANRIATQLGKKGISASAIHGNKSQAARTRALADFKAGKVNVLVATDIAARGIDIIDLPHVVNFDLPHVPEDYVHRIGRTGRAGSKGEAISLVSADEAKQLFEIERLIQNKLERIMVDDFTPDHDVPESAKNIRPPKNKKPKKNNSRNKPRYGKDSDSTGKKPNKKRSFWDNKPKKKPQKKSPNTGK